MDRKEIKEELPQAWETKSAVLKTAIAIGQLGAAPAGLWMARQKLHHRGQRPWLHRRVRIEQEHEIRQRRAGRRRRRGVEAHLAQGGVVAARKAQVLRLAQQMHPGKGRGHHIRAAVGRGVVHHPHVPGQIWGLLTGGNRRETAGQQLAHIPTDDDNRQAQHGRLVAHGEAIPERRP